MTTKNTYENIQKIPKQNFFREKGTNQAKKICIIGLTLISLMGVMNSCNTSLCNKEKDTIKKNIEKKYKLDEEAYKAWNFLRKTQEMCDNAYTKFKLEKYLGVGPSFGKDYEEIPTHYILPSITIDKKDMSLIVYPTSEMFTEKDGNAMELIIKEGKDVIVGKIRFYITVYANCIVIEKIGLNIKVNDIQIVNESTRVNDGKSTFKDPQALHYLGYFNEYIEKILGVYPSIIQLEGLAAKPKLEKEQHQKDSLKQVKEQQKEAARKILEQKMEKKH